MFIDCFKYVLRLFACVSTALQSNLKVVTLTRDATGDDPLFNLYFLLNLFKIGQSARNKKNNVCNALFKPTNFTKKIQQIQLIGKNSQRSANTKCSNVDRGQVFGPTIKIDSDHFFTFCAGFFFLKLSK